MRTFKCRGGLANDEPLQPELVHPLQRLLIVDRRPKKSSHCCSPALAPVRSAMLVGRATFSLTHRCLGCSKVTSCTKEVRLEVVHQWGGCVFSYHEILQ